MLFKKVYLQAKTVLDLDVQGAEQQPLLEGLQGAETAYSGSCFYIRIRIALGKKEYRCAFTVDCGRQRLLKIRLYNMHKLRFHFTPRKTLFLYTYLKS